MMTLQIVSPDKSTIDDIADFLLNERLVAHAIISENVIYKEKNKEGKIITSNQYILKGISKSLLFNTINEKLRALYGDQLPLIYSEPIILIDPQQTEDIIEQLVRV